MFLKYHILHTKLTPQLQDRVLDQFIKSLDREKIYFLKSDIVNIKRKNKRLFSNLKDQQCSGLYYIYNIYSRRVNERIEYAKKYLKGKFLFTRNLKYIVDEDLKKYSESTEEANKKMKAHIQYQIANIFLFEKNLKKAVKQASLVLNNAKKQVLSWKPQLNPKELRNCRTKSKNSFKACKPTKWFSNYLNAYSQSLDSHSSYLDTEDLEEFYISMNLELEGIGATLSSRFGYTVVERLVPGGAAAKSKKIKVKDKILEVGQQKDKLIPIFGERIEDVVSIIRGKQGTSVYLKILRKENKKTNTFIVKLVRERINLKEEAASISYHNINKKKPYKIGLLKVPSFYGSNFMGKSVTRDVRKLLMQARKKNIDSLVLDLSNNRGGSLDEAVRLSGLFFSKGNVVKQSEKYNQRIQVSRDTDERVFYKGPLVVLVNRLSASASEIVSGTLQNYNRAVIVGADHTFGKGSIQSIEPLYSKLGAIKTTIGLYFIPSGQSTQNIGVNADIPFPSLFSIDELGEKNLDYALPSKTITSFRSPPEEIFFSDKDPWKTINQSTIKQLKKKSQKRILKNQKFQKIVTRLEKIRKKAKTQKVTTIGKILEDSQDEEEESLDKNLSQTEKSEKKYFERPDIQEALNIANDLTKLMRKKTKKISNN